MVNVNVFHICQTQENLNTSALASVIHVKLDIRMEETFGSCDATPSTMSCSQLIELDTK